MEHLEKDIKRMWHHKDVIVLVISVVALVLSVIAICVSFDGGERHGGGEGGGYGRMMNSNENQKGMYVDDNNQNPNDGEYADDNASSSNATTSMTRKVINEVKETIIK